MVALEPELVVALDVQENHSYITIVHFIVLPSAAGGAGGGTSGTGATTGGISCSTGKPQLHYNRTLYNVLPSPICIAGSSMGEQ